jgi:hypothetical protein
VGGASGGARPPATGGGPGGPLGHVGVGAGREFLKKPDHAREALGWNAAEADRGTAAVPRPATARDTGRICVVSSAGSSGIRGGRRNGRGLRRRAWLIARLRIVGKSTRTGPAGALRRSSAARKHPVLQLGSFGRPSAWPNGNGTKSARGGFTFSVCSRTMLIDVVAMPCASSARASTPRCACRTVTWA